MAVDTQDFLTVTIPFPSYIPIARGIHAVGKGYHSSIRVLMTQDEYNVIDHAVSKIGLPKSTFGRWCMLHVALQILGSEGDENVAENVRSWGTDPDPDA